MIPLNEWKHLDITQEVFLELNRRVKDYTEELVNSAGVDSRRDSFLAGAIAALKDVVDFQFDEEPHGN